MARIDNEFGVKDYRRTPKFIQAVKLTRENIHDLAKWCGGRVEEDPKPGDPSDVYVALHIPALTGSGYANIGDYVCKDPETGGFYSLYEGAFNEKWQEYETPRNHGDLMAGQHRIF